MNSIHYRRARRADDLRVLFEALATGGRDPVIDFEDWEACLKARPHLRHRAMTRWFLSALYHEWLPLEPPTVLCADLTGDMEAYLKTRPGPWATIWSHIIRVAACATWLAERHGVDPEACYLAALLHDVHKLDEWDTGLPHADLGAHAALETLRGELSPHAVNAVVRAIRIHPERPPLSWKVARVLHDADKLDKVGATGLLRRVSKTEDLDEACFAADRSVYEAYDIPPPCIPAARELLQPKLVFARTLEPLLADVCD